MTDDELLALCRSQEYHYDCDDCWYSCPKSGNCCNNTVGDECNCGYDRRVQEKMALYKAGHQAAMEAARRKLDELEMSPDDDRGVVILFSSWLDEQVKKEGA